MRYTPKLSNFHPKNSRIRIQPNHSDCSHPLRSGLSRGYSVKKANLNRCPPHSRGFAKQYSVFRKAQNGANPGVSQDSSRSVFRFNASRSPCLFGNLAGFHPQPTLFPGPPLGKIPTGEGRCHYPERFSEIQFPCHNNNKHLLRT